MPSLSSLFEGLYKSTAGTVLLGTGPIPKHITVGTGLSLVGDVLSATGGGGGGSIGGSTGSTDNAILRADGTGGSTLQASSVIIADNGTINSTFSVGGATPIGLTLKNTDTSGRTTFIVLNDGNVGGSFGTYGAGFGAAPYQNNFSVAATNTLYFNSDADLPDSGTNTINFTTGGYNNNPSLKILGGNPGKVLVGYTSDQGTGALLQVNGSLSLATDLEVAYGGTGASALGSNLTNSGATLDTVQGIKTTDSPQFRGITVEHPSTFGRVLVKTTNNGSNTGVQFTSRDGSGNAREGGVYFIPAASDADSYIALDGNISDIHFRVYGDGRYRFTGLGAGTLVSDVNGFVSSASASTLRTNLGLGTGDSPQFARLGIAVAADANRPLTITTNSGVAAGSGSVLIQGSNNNERIELRSTTACGFMGYAFSGSISSPAQTASGQNLFFLLGRGYDNTPADTGTVGNIAIVADEAFTSSARGASIRLSCVLLGAATNAERARLSSGGNWLVGTSSDTGLTGPGGCAVNATFFHKGSELGFYNTTPITKPTVIGSRGGNLALASLCTQLAALGLIVDSTS